MKCDFQDYMSAKRPYKAGQQNKRQTKPEKHGYTVIFSPRFPLSLSQEHLSRSPAGPITYILSWWPCLPVVAVFAVLLSRCVLARPSAAPHFWLSECLPGGNITPYDERERGLSTWSLCSSIHEQVSPEAQAKIHISYTRCSTTCYLPSTTQQN